MPNRDVKRTPKARRQTKQRQQARALKYGTAK